MTQQHPITPPPELVQRWCKVSRTGDMRLDVDDLATRAAQWGADQELEACCKWLAKQGWFSADEHEAIEELRAARRPKPPSLKEQSVALLDKIQAAKERWDISELDTIRRALEQLPDNE